MLFSFTSTWVHVSISTVAHSKGTLTLLDEFVSPVFGPEKRILYLVYPRHKHGKPLKAKIKGLNPTKNAQNMNFCWHRAGVDLNHQVVLYPTRSDLNGEHDIDFYSVWWFNPSESITTKVK